MAKIRQLEDANLIEREIKRLTEQRDRLEASLYPSGIRYDSDRVQTSAADRMAEIAAQVADMDEEIRQLRIQLPMAVADTIRLINQLPDEYEKDVLTAYDINRVPMAQIADRLGYSLQHTYRIHANGRDKVQKIIEMESRGQGDGNRAD